MSASPLILADVNDALTWLRQQGVTALTVDSRKVASLASEGVAFIAWPGAATDGRAYVAQALADGARLCLVELDGVEAFGFADARIAALHGLKAASAEIAHGFFGEPSAAMDVVAVTGTNGKTSTSWWTAQALSAVGRPCGVVGTLGVGRPNGQGFASTGMTTPDPITLHATFRRFVAEGCQAAAIEASSIGIEELRLHATRIAVAQFTNFTQDHLDYHGSMDAYWAAKQALFQWPGLRAAVINLDDPMGETLVDVCRAHSLDLWTYGLQQHARLQADRLQHEAHGMSFTLVERSDDLVEVVDHAEVRTFMVGDYNVSNLLAVVGALRALGITLAQAVDACASLQPVPGRMQRVDASAELPLSVTQDLPVVVVDYADNVNQPARRWNDLIDRAQGEYLAFLDDDNTKEPRFLEIMAGVLDHQPAVALRLGARLFALRMRDARLVELGLRFLQARIEHGELFGLGLELFGIGRLQAARLLFEPFTTHREPLLVLAHAALAVRFEFKPFLHIGHRGLCGHDQSPAFTHLVFEFGNAFGRERRALFGLGRARLDFFL